ncbi:E3 ubiquitin-protein ligase RFWD2-like protein [Willisornis vidua]|uniref:E3 ubiquitin-protein ligase RFWD2-like protein n=1 Tax=Willisornis vidua TaxID=1566151 RepID=A0ABQ9DI26_9PASS|nr:E3 ubiquitin-protein ligase RFWD2-like protein [Willisornis vidua]
MPEHSLWKEFLPDTQPKPPLAELEPVPPCPIVGCLREETNPHLATTSFQGVVESDRESTDSQLKLWNVGKPHCLRSFKGHINEKNFVGLASNGDYIACGSENNSLYLYYKGLSKTLLTFKFDTVKSVLDKDRKEDDTNEFVSAVCWRALPDGESNVLIAANSQGTIKAMSGWVTPAVQHGVL